MRLKEIPSFAHESVALTQSTFLSKIMASSDSSKLVQLTRIPAADPTAAGQVQVQLISYIETDAVRTDIRAGRATQAALA
jgi:hypothetical protein